MKTQELKTLFASAQSATDVIRVFEENPGLEDEILEIGKRKGINLEAQRELTDFELELVAGGLNLKKGVLTTMAGLMIVSSLAGPLARTAHAATVTDGKPVASQTMPRAQETDDPAQDSDSSDSDNTSLNKLKDILKTVGSTSIEELTKALCGGSGLGEVLGKTGSELFNKIMDEKSEDEKTRDLLKQSTQIMLEEMDNTKKTILKDGSLNTKSIKDHIKFNTDKVINQAEKKQCQDALKDFAVNLGSFIFLVGWLNLKLIINF